MSAGDSEAPLHTRAGKVIGASDLYTRPETAMRRLGMSAGVRPRPSRRGEGDEGSQGALLTPSLVGRRYTSSSQSGALISIPLRRLLLL
ncbi:MAG: hypothetical protein DRJ56_03420 [Thermoprotei archaeon]|nr:MAG: hypothetical protein DRJ56_03420 [Thermoprotei archaeon]